MQVICKCLASLGECKFSYKRFWIKQKTNLQKIEKASRKSRKRKTATYKEEDISHSSDLDSSTEEEAEVSRCEHDLFSEKVIWFLIWFLQNVLILF